MGAQAGSWDDRRWATILDRLEFRQPDIGLRFWGPPLWLEVTMSGPDSDAWTVAAAGGVPDQPWDWQSVAPCAEATVLEAAGADDAALLEVAARYTLENLVLNAAHEIGEWLRFDAQRCFSAHGSAADGVQGNGIVSIAVNFEPPTQETPAPPATIAAVGARAGRLAGLWRFTYLPGRPIGFEADETLGLLEVPDEVFVAAVQRDVHRTLVRYEAQRVCDAFYVDGIRRWARVQPLISYEPAPGDTRPSTGRPSVPVRNG